MSLTFCRYLLAMSSEKDPVSAARGALKGRLLPSEQLREQARRDEEAAERRTERASQTKRKA